MRPVRATFRFRFAPAILAAAIAHQLGACPCGCFDGNLWIQEIRGAWHSVQLDTPKSTSDRSQQGQQYKHVCDDTPVVFVLDGAGAASQAIHANSLALVDLLPLAHWDALFVVTGERDAFVPANRLPESALMLRAQLQVRLI